MKVMVLGSTGTIGQNIANKLPENYEVFRVSRHNEVSIDFNNLPSDEDLIDMLSGIDCLINAIGLGPGIKNNPQKKLYLGLRRFMEIAIKANVPKIINLSAFSNHPEPELIPYLKYKYQLDQYLLNNHEQVAIVRPSLVFSEKGASTQFFKIIAKFPFIPMLDRGRQLVDPIHIDDLVEFIDYFIKVNTFKSAVYEVGSGAITMADYIKTITQRHPKFLSMPTILMRPAFSLLYPFMPPVGGKFAFKLLNAGSVVKENSFPILIGREPLTPDRFK